jgi:hypothetical protein
MNSVETSLGVPSPELSPSTTTTGVPSPDPSPPTNTNTGVPPWWINTDEQPLPDKLGVTPLSVIKANEGNSGFKKDYGAYMPANASNPVWRALIKPLYQSQSEPDLEYRLGISEQRLADYIANQVQGTDINDEIQNLEVVMEEIKWPITEVYNRVLRSIRSPLVGGKRKSKRRLGKSKKGKKGKKSRGRKGKNSKKKRKSRKTKTKKSRQNK